MKDPFIEKIDDSRRGLEELEKKLKEKGSEKAREILLEFPTVYIHNWKNTKEYEVYIGETNNILQRTRQHWAEGKVKDGWRRNLLKGNASLYIIGHEHFNKSLTLDIENRFMMYLMSVECVRRIHNKKTNPQRKYYPGAETDIIFESVWRMLRRENKELFPSESVIKDSALFKASPLHRLTDEQLQIKDAIIEKVFLSLQKQDKHQLIFIEGEAGTGKTVLNSSTFYEIYCYAEENGKEDLRCCMIVNHDEQITVYRQVAAKLGLTDKYGEVVYKPTSFINHRTEDDPIDVAFVDEAHLLLTQGKQSYRGKNQLEDIIRRARVTVVMFDENQILTAEQYWEQKNLEHFRRMAKEQKKTLTWAERPQTIDEVGSTYTIHGFDLNYAGVILGPSVKYRNGRIVFDPDKSKNKKAIQNRTLSDGSRQKFGKQLIQHEVRILMTRGVEGLYIYACDNELRKALKQAEATGEK